MAVTLSHEPPETSTKPPQPAPSPTGGTRLREHGQEDRPWPSICKRASDVSKQPPKGSPSHRSRATDLEHLLSLLQGLSHFGKLELQEAVGMLLPLQFLRRRRGRSGVAGAPSPVSQCTLATRDVCLAADRLGRRPGGVREPTSLGFLANALGGLL